jgi:NADH pyrophosphatase NudC (nudix superfamily)
VNRYHLKEKATQLGEEFIRIEAELETTLIELQQKCIHPHEVVIQAPYQSSSYFSDSEEIRFCTMCGLQEERSCTGWHYIINRTGEYGRGEPFKQVKRDDIWSARSDILHGTSVGVRDKEHLEGR